MTAREDFVRCAQEQVGKPYVWGTAGPDTFDCSGLSAYCYQQATGETITRSSYEQFKLGSRVGPNDPHQPADLLFWGHDGRADHVGICSVNGEVINALNEQRGVVVTRALADYGMPFLGARRILTDDPTEEAPSSKSPRRPRKLRRLIRQRRDA